MMCPKCTLEMEQVARGSFQCEVDEVLVTVGTRDEPNPADEEPDSSAPHVPGFMPLDVSPRSIRRGDLIVLSLKLRKVIDLRRPGWSDRRLLLLKGGGAYLMKGRERVYRATEPDPTPAPRTYTDSRLTHDSGQQDPAHGTAHPADRSGRAPRSRHHEGETTYDSDRTARRALDAARSHPPAVRPHQGRAGHRD